MTRPGSRRFGFADLARGLLAVSSILLGLPSVAVAGPYDGAPKILLHRMIPAAKNQCARGLLADCAGAVTAAPVGAGSYIYLLAARGALPSVASVELGLDYQGGDVNGRADHQGLDI